MLKLEIISAFAKNQLVLLNFDKKKFPNPTLRDILIVRVFRFKKNVKILLKIYLIAINFKVGKQKCMLGDLK